MADLTGESGELRSNVASDRCVVLSCKAQLCTVLNALTAAHRIELKALKCGLRPVR